jgi:polysaccharide pyruvyl transferase WcaK-like protein
VLDKFTNRIQEVVRQTSLLNVQRQTEVASVLLRVILDLTTYQFLKSHGITPERHLDKNLRSAIKRIEPHASDALGQAETTTQLQKAFHETTADNIRLVQYAVHDVHSARTPNEVLILAARYHPVLVAMNQHMGNNPIA